MSPLTPVHDCGLSSLTARQRLFCGILSPHIHVAFPELASVFLDPLTVWLPLNITRQYSPETTCLRVTQVSLHGLCSALLLLGQPPLLSARRGTALLPRGAPSSPRTASPYLTGRLCWTGRASCGRRPGARPHFHPKKGRWRHSAARARSPSPSGSDSPGPICKATSSYYTGIVT